MARYADTRKHRQPAAEPTRTTIVLERRLTLYGHGINPGHIRLQPGATATLIGNTIEWADTDGTTYSTTTPEH